MSKNILNGLVCAKFLQNNFDIWNILCTFAVGKDLRARQSRGFLNNPKSQFA